MKLKLLVKRLQEYANLRVKLITIKKGDYLFVNYLLFIVSL
jgi:hypothetical protein